VPVRARRAESWNVFYRARTLQAETWRPCRGHFDVIPRTRTVSPSTHPRPASHGATDFLPASAPSDHQQALQPAGGEDTRCVQPISATQSNCVHPHLARSRLTLATFAARTSRGVLGSARQDRGTERFTTFEDRFGRSSCNTETRAPWSCDRSWRDTSVGVFFPRR
jgi:hypothetical protein